MKRSELRSDPEKTRAWQERSRQPIHRNPMPRVAGPIRAQSKKRRASKPERDRVRENVFARDQYCCKLIGFGRCFGELTVHHRRKASQGGKYVEWNLVTMCAHHNDQLEADADLAAYARSVGLVLLREDIA